jgi:hypothetical protein
LSKGVILNTLHKKVEIIYAPRNKLGNRPDVVFLRAQSQGFKHGFDCKTYKDATDFEGKKFRDKHALN